MEKPDNIKQFATIAKQALDLSKQGRTRSIQLLPTHTYRLKILTGGNEYGEGGYKEIEVTPELFAQLPFASKKTITEAEFLAWAKNL